MAVNAVWLQGMGLNSRSAVLWRGMGWYNDIPNPHAWFEKVLMQALNTISFVVQRRSNDNPRLATAWLVWGFGQEVYGDTMNIPILLSVTPRRLDESILKRSDGLGTVKTIIWAFYFRWRRGSSFLSLYWCTGLPLSQPLLKTSLQPLQRLELLLLPGAWCGSCGELIDCFALSVFSFCGIDLIV